MDLVDVKKNLDPFVWAPVNWATNPAPMALKELPRAVPGGENGARTDGDVGSKKWIITLYIYIYK